MRRRRSRGAGGLKRDLNWSAYELSSDAQAFLAEGQSMTRFYDWIKVPGGVWDSTFSETEPIGDTWASLLTWGTSYVQSASVTPAFGIAQVAMGIIDWHGTLDNTTFMEPEEVPSPYDLGNAEWIWWQKESFRGMLPASDSGVYVSQANFADWQRRSSAKRKLGENKGVLLCIDVVNESEDDLMYFPGWYFRFLCHSSEWIVPRR